MDFHNGLTRLRKPLKFGLSTAILTALISLAIPDRYQSEVRLLPVDTKSSMGGGIGQLAAAATAFGIQVPGQDGGDSNFVDILGSRWLREKLLQTTFVYHIRPWKFGTEVEKKETLLAYTNEKNFDRGIREISRIMSVSKDVKSKMITIVVETKSRDLSQALVEKAVALLEEFVQRKGRTRGGAKAVFAEARLEEARKELLQAEDEFRKFLDVNRNYQVSTDPGTRLRGARLEMEFKLRQQLVTTLALNREQALIEEKNDLPIVNAMDTGNLPQEKSRPGRSMMVLLAFLFGTVGYWGALNWSWVAPRLFPLDKPVDSQ